ncbi:MAG: hypothetical protein WKF75_01625 [Singulisphaera sp.]
MTPDASDDRIDDPGGDGLAWLAFRYAAGEPGRRRLGRVRAEVGRRPVAARRWPRRSCCAAWPARPRRRGLPSRRAPSGLAASWWWPPAPALAACPASRRR